MFRLGDKVDIIQSVNTLHGYIHPGTHVVTSISEDNSSIQIDGYNWWIHNSYFILLEKNIPKNEMEWLDRIQENFR